MCVRFVLTVLPVTLLAACPAAAGGTYKCSGTEPFWSLAISADAISYDDAGGNTLSLKPVAPRWPAGTSADYILVYETTAKASTEAFTIVVSKDDEGNCSDGMSDISYPYAVVFVSKARVLHGCCNRP